MIEMIKKLIEINTVDSKNGDKIIEIILDYLKGTDFKYEIVEKEGVKNLIAWKGDLKNVKIILNGHWDVVPADPKWDPFLAREIDGFIYGRGSGDMKSGLGVAIDVFKNSKRKDLMLMAVGDEEKGGYKGTKVCVEWLKKKGVKPKYVLITEPVSEKEFGDAIKIGRRGVLWLDVRIKGIPTHASRPEKGKNPIDALSLFNQFTKNIKLPEDEMGKTSIAITSFISKSNAYNATPKEGLIRIDIRKNAATKTKEIIKRFKEFFNSLGYDAEINIKIDEPSFLNKDKRLENIVIESFKKYGYNPRKSTTGGASDARFFDCGRVELGIVSRNIHSFEEHASIEEIKKLKNILEDILKIL